VYCPKLAMAINNAKNNEGIKAEKSQIRPPMASSNRLSIKPCS
jgi:hypothetical protein